MSQPNISASVSKIDCSDALCIGQSQESIFSEPEKEVLFDAAALFDASQLQFVLGNNITTKKSATKIRQYGNILVDLKYRHNCLMCHDTGFDKAILYQEDEFHLLCRAWSVKYYYAIICHSLDFKHIIAEVNNGRLLENCCNAPILQN
jgi:hypothetical protein